MKIRHMDSWMCESILFIYNPSILNWKCIFWLNKLSEKMRYSVFLHDEKKDPVLYSFPHDNDTRSEKTKINVFTREVWCPKRSGIVHGVPKKIRYCTPPTGDSRVRSKTSTPLPHSPPHVFAYSRIPCIRVSSDTDVQWISCNCVIVCLCIRAIA